MAFCETTNFRLIKFYGKTCLKWKLLNISRDILLWWQKSERFHHFDREVRIFEGDFLGLAKQWSRIVNRDQSGFDALRFTIGYFGIYLNPK